jgi:hypothetical protein
MKPLSTISLFLGLGLLSASSSASTLTVEVATFSDATLFSITSGNNLDLRVAELTSAQGANSSTHILIEQLTVVEATDQEVFGSAYSGVDIATGEVQDTGVVYLRVPGGISVPEGSVASPIVGIVERAGSWSAYGLQQPQAPFGGLAGSGAFGAGQMSLSLSKGGPSYTGAIDYTVVDVNTLEFDPFTVTAVGGEAVDLSGGFFVRNGDRYVASVANQNPGADYDSLFLQIFLSNIPDADNDGILDLVDDDVVPVGPVDLLVGQVNATYAGDLFGLTANWGMSTDMGLVMAAGYNVLYHPHFGWMIVVSQPQAGTWWMYSPEHGWMYRDISYEGFFAMVQPGTVDNWVWNHFTEQRVIAVATAQL